MQNIRSPLQAQVVQWLVQAGDAVAAGDVLVIVEAMKMEHEIRAPHAGRLGELFFQPGEAVNEGEALGTLQPIAADDAAHAVAHDASPSAHAAATATPSSAPSSTQDPQTPRADLQQLQTRLAFTHDAQRPEAVAKRHALGLRTARENIADLCDALSLIHI